jgi:hypothetical protein
MNQLAIPFDSITTVPLSFVTEGNLIGCQFLGFSCYIEGKLDSYQRITIYELNARKGLKGYDKQFSSSVSALQEIFCRILTREFTEALGTNIKFVLKK